MSQANLHKYRNDLTKLIKLGDQMRVDLHIQITEREGALTSELKAAKSKVGGSFEANYQRWYSEAYAVVKQLIPDRVGEFFSLYRADPKRKRIDLLTYRIQDWMLGARASVDVLGEKPLDDLGIVGMLFKTQLAILKSTETRFESSLHDIQQLVQADLLDSEIGVSTELLKRGLLRAAGAVAGVAIEKHVKQVCNNHNVVIRRMAPSISDMNAQLKKTDIIDTPTWRFIQHLADLRNMCVHDKKTEPTPEQVRELIDGAKRITKTLY